MVLDTTHLVSQYTPLLAEQRIRTLSLSNKVNVEGNS